MSTLNRNYLQEIKIHYKGRICLFVGTTLVGVNLGIGVVPVLSVHADTTGSSTSISAVTSSNTIPTTSNTKSVADTSTSNATTTSSATTTDNNNNDNSSSVSSESSAVSSDSSASPIVSSASGATSSSDSIVARRTIKTKAMRVRSLTDTATGATEYDRATSIVNNKKAVVAESSEKLSATYSFIPKFNQSGKTKVSVIGSADLETNNDKVSVNLDTATKGQTGFKYTNIGYDADGNSIDLEIMYNDWGRLDTNETAYVESYTNKISTDIAGAGWVDVEYRFIYSDTGDIANVSGLLTLTDIDGGQTVSVSNKQWADIDTVYVPQSSDPTTGNVDNWLRYTNTNSYVKIVSPSVTSKNNDKFAMLTFTYSNQHSLSFRYSNGKTTTASVANKWSVNYIAQKPLATAVIAPNARVTDSDQTSVKNNILKDGENHSTYVFKQTIPDEWAQYYYHNVSFTTTLPANTALDSYAVIDENGVDVKKHFKSVLNGQKWTLTVDSDYLNSADFYGHYYTINANVMMTQIDTVQNLKMSLTTIIDGETQSSNKVTTIVSKKHYLVTHYFIKGTTTKLAADTKTHVIYGATYKTSNIDIIGYSVISKSNTSGIFTDDNVAAIYEYEPMTISISVTYLDQNGKINAKSTTISGKYGTSYDATSLDKTISGYKLSLVDNKTGTYSLSNAGIVFHYQANVINIMLNYINIRTGKILKASSNISGLNGDAYSVNKYEEEINGYTFKKASKVTGIFDLGTPVIVFYYAPKKVTTNVYEYLLADKGYGQSLENTYAFSGFVDDSVRIKASDYSDEDYYIKKGTPAEQTIRLTASNNIIKFYYTTEETTETDFHSVYVSVDTAHEGTVVDIFVEYPNSTLEITRDSKTQKVDYILTNNAGTLAHSGKLVAGGTGFTSKDQNYQINWGEKYATVTRVSKITGEKSAFKVKVNTGEVVTATVSRKNSFGQIMTWKKNYIIGEKSTTLVDTRSNKVSLLIDSSDIRTIQTSYNGALLKSYIKIGNSWKQKITFGNQQYLIVITGDSILMDPINLDATKSRGLLEHNEHPYTQAGIGYIANSGNNGDNENIGKNVVSNRRIKSENFTGRVVDASAGIELLPKTNERGRSKLDIMGILILGLILMWRTVGFKKREEN